MKNTTRKDTTQKYLMTVVRLYTLDLCHVKGTLYFLVKVSQIYNSGKLFKLSEVRAEGGGSAAMTRRTKRPAQFQITYKIFLSCNIM